MTAFSPGRFGAVLVKEFIQMRRDRITFAMMLGVPLIQLLLFGFAINSDPKSLPAALVATVMPVASAGMAFANVKVVVPAVASYVAVVRPSSRRYQV